MICSCSIGSEGTGDDSFSIMFPLVLSPGKELNFEDNCSFCLSGDLCFNFKKHHNLYTLKVGRFPTKEAASNFVDILISSLRWVSLKNMLGIRFPNQVHNPEMSASPILVSEKNRHLYETVVKNGWTTIDGNYNVHELTIIPEDKKLILWEAGHVSVTLGLNPQNIFNDISESISFKKLINIHSEKKLCLAIELYSAYQFEVSTTAKFIKLVTVIESLLPNQNIPSSVIPFLEKAKQLLVKEKEILNQKNESTDSLDHLISRLQNLRRQSINSTMASYISKCLDDFPELGEKSELLPKIRRIYNLRSSLLHTGEFEEPALEEGIEILSNFVPNLLKKLYLASSS